MPQVEFVGNTMKSNGFDLAATRCGILLFDQLVHPSNNAFSIGELRDVTGDLDGVSDAIIQMSCQGVTTVFPTALATMFQKLEAREPGLWSLARGTQGVAIPEEILGGLSAFKIKLENALPMPDIEVPFEDVANYRERRRAELIALRHSLEGLALEVSRDGFSNLAQTRALEQLKVAIAEHTRAINETNWLKRPFSLDVSFNWSDLVAKLGPSVLLGSFDLKIGLAALTASISVESARGLLKNNAQPRPFDYLFKARAMV